MDRIIKEIKAKILKNRKLENDLDPSDENSEAILYIKYGCFADGLEAALSIIEGGLDNHDVSKSIVSEGESKGSCPACNGTGEVEGEHNDDIQPCRNC